MFFSLEKEWGLFWKKKISTFSRKHNEYNCASGPSRKIIINRSSLIARQDRQLLCTVNWQKDSVTMMGGVYYKYYVFLVWTTTNKQKIEPAIQNRNNTTGTMHFCWSLWASVCISSYLRRLYAIYRTVHCGSLWTLYLMYFLSELNARVICRHFLFKLRDWTKFNPIHPKVQSNKQNWGQLTCASLAGQQL